MAPLRRGLPASLGGQRVVLAGSACGAFAPRGVQQTGAFHLVQRRIDGALLEEERPLAPPLRLLEHLVRVHRAFAEQAEDEDADGAGQELAVVVHCLGQQGSMPCLARQTRCVVIGTVVT